MVFELLFQGKVVEFAAERELPVDLFLADAEVLHIEEANVLRGIAELVYQLCLAIRLVESAQVESDELGPVDY